MFFFEIASIICTFCADYKYHIRFSIGLTLTCEELMKIVQQVILQGVRKVAPYFNSFFSAILKSKKTVQHIKS